MTLPHDLTMMAWVMTTNLPVKELAEKSGFSEGTVRNIKMLKTDKAKMVKEYCDHWHLETFLLEPQKRFTKRQVATIRDSTATSKTLAKRYGVSESTIRMVKTGKTYNGQ
jgi:DNA-binding Xre family transcriptional regulator